MASINLLGAIMSIKKIYTRIKLALFKRRKNSIEWEPLDYEMKILNNAKLKIFLPTIESANHIVRGGMFSTELSYTDLQQNKHTVRFDIALSTDKNPGIIFKLSTPNTFNIKGVKHAENYGLLERITLTNREKNIKYIIPENSVREFETSFPSTPLVLEGRFTQLKTDELVSTTYCRAIIPIKDKEMIYPTSILDYADNHMKFDIESWDRQKSLIGIPFLSTKGMFVELLIKGMNFHYYGIEQYNAHIIDSTEKLTIEEFYEISYAIRLCFAFVSGKFYKDEIILLTSDRDDFSEIQGLEYKAESTTIITDNQIINPTFFFQQYEKEENPTKEIWKEFHEMFSPAVFSAMCEKALESPEFSRCLELVINAGNIDDYVQKGALYSVCIETLTELIKTENENSFKPIPNEKVGLWNTLQAQLEEALNKLEAEIGEPGHGILTKKVSNLNSPTNREKLERPFKMTGIILTEEELNSLNQRNNYLHGGQPEVGINSKLNALRLHNLIGKLVLKYFNYKGHLINVTAWNLLKDKESKRMIEQFNIKELEDTLEKIQSESLDSLEEVETAKVTMKNFAEFSATALEIKELIQII